MIKQDEIKLPSTDPAPASALQTSARAVKIWFLGLRYLFPSKFVDEIESALYIQLTGFVDRERDKCYIKGYNAGFKAARRYFTSGTTQD